MIKQNYSTLTELYQQEAEFWQSEAIAKQVAKINDRLEDRLMHAITIRDEVRRGLRISDEEIEVTIYAWLQRFKHYSPRFDIINDITVGEIKGRLILDMFWHYLEFEPELDTEQFKQLFLEQNPEFVGKEIINFDFETANSDLLIHLARQGVKTAYSSPLRLYESRNHHLPEVGDLAIFNYQNGNAAMLVEVTKAEMHKFKDISRRFAFQEGEADRSLSYWKILNHLSFKRALAGFNLIFSEEEMIVCQNYKVLSRALDLFGGEYGDC